jgi:hypothetical protein
LSFSHMLYYDLVLIHTLADLNGWCCQNDSFRLKMMRAEENKTIRRKKHVSYFNEAIA